jgi:uncharacterized protein (DUF1330 family)
MAAYILAQIEVTDPEQFEAYRRQVPDTLQPYGGRYIIRGAQSETLEGDWQPKRLVVLEFPDQARAKAWWASQEYAPVKSVRQRSAKTALIVIDGV